MSFANNLLDEFLSTHPHVDQQQSDSHGESGENEHSVKVRHIKVNQIWIDRSKTFLELYFQQVDITNVDQQYRTSDFTNFQTFLNFNSLHYFESTYLRATNKIIWLDADIVEKAREKTQTKCTLEEFIKKEGILQYDQSSDKKSYARVVNLFSKIKWLEILLGLDITKIIDSEGMLMADTMDQMFGDKIISLKFMLACYLAGLAKFVTSDFQLVEYDEFKTTSFSAFPVGLVFDKDSFAVLLEWKNNILDHLASTMKFSGGETTPLT